MPVHAFLARPFDHTHENEVFDRLLARLDAKWGQGDEDVVVIGNPLWGGCDPDCVVMKRSAITIVDFKNFGGPISVLENGPWRSAGGPVKGGSKTNPLHQVRDNKYALKNWFEREFPELDHNFGHITGLVVFHQPVQIEGEFPPQVQTWFKVTDLEGAADVLGYFASKGINLDRKTLLDIPARLGVEPHHPLWRNTWVEEVGGRSTLAAPAPERVWTQDQRVAIEGIQRFLEQPEKPVFRLLGMTSTGKTALVPAIHEAAQALGRPVVLLAPNSRIATVLSNHSSQSFESLYSHLFDASKVVRPEITEKGHKRVSVHPFRSCEDDPNCLYVIEEAHLLGNSYFEVEGERFGSGRLWEDFIAFTELDKGTRKVILIGDPYQLHRGGKADMPLHGDLLQERQFSVDAFELGTVIKDQSRETLVGNAKQIVEAIREQRFNRLALNIQGECLLPPEGDNLSFTTDQFQRDMRGCQVIRYSNKAVAQLNRKLRERLLDTKGLPLVPGDRVELYSALKIKIPLEADTFVSSGEFADVVTSSREIREKQQSLKGRDKSVVWHEGQVGLHPDGSTKSLPSLTFLLDFLEAEKPELDGEQAVALRVHYKKEIIDGIEATLSDGAELPIRLRYAYAATCHHAQGIRKPTVLIDCNTEQGRNNEEYFRWLYTAITRAERQCYLLNYAPITPFQNARWSETGVRMVKDIKGGLTFQVDPSATPLPEDLERPQPHWSSDPSRAQLWFWLELSKCLEPAGWTVPRVTSHPYQEHYELLGPSGQTASIALSHNKENAITGVRLLRGDSSPLALLERRSSEISLRDVRGVGPLAELKARLTSTGWIIEQVTESNFLLTARLAKGGTGKVKLDLYFGGDGMVSTLRVTETTSLDLLPLLRELLCPSEEKGHE